MEYRPAENGVGVLKGAYVYMVGIGISRKASLLLGEEWF